MSFLRWSGSREAKSWGKNAACKGLHTSKKKIETWKAKKAQRPKNPKIATKPRFSTFLPYLESLSAGVIDDIWGIESALGVEVESSGEVGGTLKRTTEGSRYIAARAEFLDEAQKRVENDRSINGGSENLIFSRKKWTIKSQTSFR
jgi:hypothetical protein